MIYNNGVKLQVTKFPNGESLLPTNWIVAKEGKNEIEFKFESNEDLIHLMFLKRYLDEVSPKANNVLTIKYTMYSRMDRTENQTIFTLKYICQLINSLNFDKVVIHEPHSDVCVALLDRVEVVNTTCELTKKELEKIDNSNLYIVYPDNGACKRYSKQIKYNKVLTCSKERDFSTGEIIKLNIDGEVPKESFNAIIVDDLCSGGRTFIETAKKLKEIGCQNITLIVTHCENTILTGDIFKTDLINKVITTNSILNYNEKTIKLIHDDRLEIVEL